MLTTHVLNTDIADQFQQANKLEYLSWTLPNALENRDAMSTAWYMPTTLSLSPSARPELDDPEDEDGMQQSLKYIESLIEECESQGIPTNRVVVGGFSQGCAMSLLLGLTSKKYAGKIAGIVGLMGYLPLSDRLQALRAEAKLPAKVGEVPMFLARGERDMLISKRVWNLTLKGLKDLGVAEDCMQVEEYEGLGHGINAGVMADMLPWLEKVVPKLEG